MATAKIRLEISESEVSIANNTSRVTAKLYYYGNGVSFNNDAPPGWIKIDGTKYNFNHDFSTSTSAQLLASKSKTVKHNSDGSKTVSCSASFTTRVSIGTLTTSTSKKLKKIPRTSTLTVSRESVYADGQSAVTVTSRKASADFDDTIILTLGERSMEITSGQSFSIPLAWNDQIRTTWRSATIKVTTRASPGGTLIGSASKSLKVMLPDDIIPTITDINVSEAMTEVQQMFGQYVQSMSKLNVGITAEGQYGAGITSYNTEIDGIRYLEQNFQSNIIKSSGTIQIRATVKDSRGRASSEFAKSIAVAEYFKPVITDMTYIQCDPDGTENRNGNSTKISISGRTAEVGGNNAAALKIDYKAAGGTTQSHSIQNIGYVFDTDAIINNTDPNITYEYVAVLSDKKNIVEYRLSTGLPVLSLFAGGKGARFFGEADGEGLKVGNVDFSISDAEYAEFVQNTGAKRLFEMLKVLRIQGLVEPVPVELIRDKDNTPSESTYECVYVPILNMCFFTTLIKPRANTDYDSNTAYTLWTVPAEYRPAQVGTLSAYCGGSTNVNAYVRPAGEINIQPKGARLTKGWLAGVSGQWFVGTGE